MDDGKALRCVILTVAFLGRWAVAAGVAGVAGSVAAGNRAYRGGRFDEALERYWSAEVRAPDSPIVNFNIGNALYKQGKSDPAMQAWRKALRTTRDRLLQSDILSNMGTAALRAGNRDEAVALFAEALRRNPKNIRARYNLLQAQLFHPSQTADGGNGDQRRNGDGDRRNDAAGVDDRRQEDEQGTRDGGRDDRPQMTREDVQRLLELHEQQQQHLRQRQARPAAPVIPETDRDW